MRWMNETMTVVASALPGEENCVSEGVGTPCNLCDGKKIKIKTTRIIMWVCRIGRYLLMERAHSPRRGEAIVLLGAQEAKPTK